MDSERIEQRLAEIDRKLELLVEQLEITRRQQREYQELKDDLSRIATDVFDTATTEFEDVAPHFDNADLVHLLKKLLRNTRNISKMLDRLDSFSDFIEDAAPLQKAAFSNLLETLDEMDRKGYFVFLAEIKNVADRIVSSFSPEDVRLLGDNIVTILSTVRNFTQPELLTALNNALAVYQNLDAEVEEDVSYRQMFREARSPEVRRGLVAAMRFLKNVSSPDRRTLTRTVPTLPDRPAEDDGSDES